MAETNKTIKTKRKLTPAQEAGFKKGQGYFKRTTKEKQREIARMGGLASQEKARELKTIKEYLEIGAKLPFEDTDRNMLAEGCRKLMLNFAKNGDSKSAEAIAKLLGQYVQEVKAQVNTTISKDFVDNFLDKFREIKEQKEQKETDKSVEGFMMDI